MIPCCVPTRTKMQHSGSELWRVILVISDGITMYIMYVRSVSGTLITNGPVVQRSTLPVGMYCRQKLCSRSHRPLTMRHR